jgi:hypothetical protein
MSVWRMSVPELRSWMTSRGSAYSVPDDIWETVAQRGVIDLGHQTSYDVETGLFVSVHGIDRDQLVPIELDDWIDLVEPYNTDPLNPR